ncbi:ABC transporter permease [Cohnella sp. JJ-181]|uniref:ABC transporter permease n=1 Tax=Cohnella rhizoplanae TaxID=2974897 RepID=UPI0022FF6C8F|nr:ABC transporter permease [Cohnella sp. JJ-181]CAI6085199.1 Linearmycin resistance permease protein LnrN [Cohnella sp. JJ-181]
MKTILWLMAHTLRNTFRKRSNIILFLLPVAGVMLSAGLYGQTGGTGLSIGIVQQDGADAVGRDVAAFVGALDGVKLTDTSDADLRDRIAAGKLDAGIVIPPGFGESLKAGKPMQLELLSVKGAQVTAYVQAMLDGYLNNVASIAAQAKGDEARFEQIYGEYTKGSFKVSREQLTDASNVKDTTYQSLGFLVAFMMFSAVNMSEMILREKENRTFLRLLSSPVTAKSYVAANVAVNVVAMVFQTALTLCFMRYVLDIDSGVPIMQLAFSLVLFGIGAIALSLLIVSLSKSRGQSSALQNLIITPTCLLAGCYFPMEIMPDAIRKIGAFLPQHWLLDTVNRLQQGDSFGSLYMNLLILAAFAAAFAAIAIFRFSRNNDTRTFV